MEDEVIEIDENGVVHDPRIDWKSRAETAEASLTQAQQALRELVSEASGFVSMASIGNHGITNIRVLEGKIEAARKVLAEAALPSDTQGAQ